MKRVCYILLGALFCGPMLAAPAFAEDMSNAELTERVMKLEEKAGGFVSDAWTDRVTISGLIEAEAGYATFDPADPGANSEDESDVVLATVELGVDVDIAKHVTGHVLLLWEEDDTEPMDVDEAFITLDGKDVCPLYLSVGKLYVPFGNFESHFISDPLTLELGETRESAIQAGFVSDLFQLSAALFNGDIDETGEDNHVDSFVAAATFTLPEDAAGPIGVAGGLSYISNLADTDGLEGETPGQVADRVGGFSAFVSLSLADLFFLEAEYLTALDDFAPGELSFDGGGAAAPKAWNLELAWATTEQLEVAVKYEGGDDLGDFLPEQQWGAAASYALFENTCLAVEYRHGEFETDDTQDVLTAQLAVAF